MATSRTAHYVQCAKVFHETVGQGAIELEVVAIRAHAAVAE